MLVGAVFWVLEGKAIGILGFSGVNISLKLWGMSWSAEGKNVNKFYKKKCTNVYNYPATITGKAL